jgi:hypothetical protein
MVGATASRQSVVRVVGVVTLHEAVVWSDAPLLRGAVRESAETAPSHVPRRTCGREPSRATHDRRRRGGHTLDAVDRDGAMAKSVRRHVKPIMTTRPTTRPATPPSAPGWTRSRSRFPPHRFLEGGVGKASRCARSRSRDGRGCGTPPLHRTRSLCLLQALFFAPVRVQTARTPRRPTGSMAMIAGVGEAPLSMHSLATPRWRSMQDATLIKYDH